MICRAQSKAIRVTKDGETMEKHQAIQRNVKDISKIQDEFGGYTPDLINMYFAAKLKSLTTVLIWLTAILSVLAVAQIIVLVWSLT
jgi:hypothetical protein